MFLCVVCLFVCFFWLFFFLRVCVWVGGGGGGCHMESSVLLSLSASCFVSFIFKFVQKTHVTELTRTKQMLFFCVLFTDNKLYFTGFIS